ncbi:uncharacterized protein LOC128260280 [Drosophila gunungcola]|uniref:uncharacterized protein LOC128260280 n=1 Tax=Drosophila gunungcola TaxID=103775 RepID=UPI0022E5D55C|nr:uncharacterized protein LOC128260280 [Drosophila gunungcola]
MNDPWREIGFVSKRKSKNNLQIIQIKKRIAKSRKLFEQRRTELIQLHLRNRIKYLIIENLKYRLAENKRKRKIQKSLKQYNI